MITIRLYFGGAEVPGHRSLLAACGVEAVSLSFIGLTRRYKKLGEWRIADKFPDNQAVFLDSGAYSLNKEGAEYTDEEAKRLAEAYISFVDGNLDRLEMVSEFDALQLGREWIENVRAHFWDALGDKFLPVWHAEDGPEELERLTRKYYRVGVLQSDTTPDYTALLNASIGLSGARLHGVAMTKKEMMQQIRWDSVGSTSWLSPSQYGDTFVWTGRELQRYPKKYKEQARKRHRTLFENNGFDAEKITADDTTEVLKLSIWSWRQFVASINHDDPVVTPSPEIADEGKLERGRPRVGIRGSELENEELGSEPRERVLLPILSMMREPAEGEKDPERRVGLSDVSLMQCNTCYIKGKCPAYKPGSDCAYEIPMELTTTTQVRALRKTVLGMQAQRAAMARTFEQVEGGYPDANVSGEIRLLWKMIQDDQAADKGGEGFEIKVTGSGNSGFISRVFGSETGNAVAALPAPQPSSGVLESLGIVDAEVIDERVEHGGQ